MNIEFLLVERDILAQIAQRLKSLLAGALLEDVVEDLHSTLGQLHRGAGIGLREHLLRARTRIQQT